jgi:hypothetical protein
MPQVPGLGCDDHWHEELEYFRTEFKGKIKQHTDASEAIEKVQNVLVTLPV